MRICIISTGGTILAQENSCGYEAAKLGFNAVFKEILSEFKCEFSIKTPFNLGSQNITNKILLKLANCVNNASKKYNAIIIAHGSDTLEESAFFLHLIKNNKTPIIMCAAMFPPQNKKFDGKKNLISAINLALNANLQDCSVLCTMDNEIYPARYLLKLKSIGQDAFKSPFGLKIINNELKFIDEKFANFLPKIKNLQKPFKLPKKLPKVAVIYIDTNFNPSFYNLKKLDGIVLCGFGAGTLPNLALKYFKNFKIPVVRSSRCAFSKVSLNGEIDDNKYDFIPANDLSAQKAKILLTLALCKTKDKKMLKKYFLEI